MASQTRVRRRAVACARCRLRKTLCDAASPSCSRCLEAGVACMALTPASKRPAPRSIAQYLETEIANRESNDRLALLTKTFGEQAVTGDSTRPLSDLETGQTIATTIMADFTPGFLGISEAMPLAPCTIGGTRVPSTRLFGSTDIDEDHPRSILNPQSPATSLESIPIEASSYLFTNYMERIVPQYPILYATELKDCYDSVYRRSHKGAREASSFDIYVISLVMAISLTTAARTQQARASAIAGGLFKNAIRRLPEVLTNSLEGVQAVLLLLQYSFLDPGAANIWLLSGFASQACIDLGLHQDMPPDSQISVLDRDMRRRVFWCAYEMETAVSAALLRPTNLLRKYINVQYPSEIDDNAISPHGIDPTGRPTKLTSHRIWKFREIEAEIVSVLFQNENFPSCYSTLEEWMATMEVAIARWDDEVHSWAAMNTDQSMVSKWAEMDLYASIATPYILVTLFRPCPRIKEPSHENLMKAFVAAVKVATGYWQQANLDFGNSKYVFHPCHHTFSAAVAFLQALQRCGDFINIKYTREEVEDFMGAFSRLFATIAERWPQASKCLDEYERLLAPIKKDYLDFVRVRNHSISHDPELMEEPIHFHEDLMQPTMDLDEMIYFGSFFNPSELSVIDNNNWGYSPAPANWNVEFDFDIV